MFVYIYGDDKMKEKEYIEKKMENGAEFLAANQIEAIFNDMPWDCISRETRKKFFEFLDSLQKDIGCLECEEMCGYYIVEYGYNYKEVTNG